jgi:hypothetical protein
MPATGTNPLLQAPTELNPFAGGPSSLAQMAGRAAAPPGRSAAAMAAPARPAQEVADVVLPMPKSKADLVEGQIYQTKFGPLEWNGTKFVKPKTAAQ